MKIYRAGIYARLSVRGSERKAESIENQFLICRGFANVTDDIEIIGCYSDFGKSGMNYDRPGFKRMYEDILAKKIDCVIVKDLSRFGRNHIDTGEFLQKIFPLLGVRFIAVSDGYDSISDMFGKKEFAVNLKNLVNELYCFVRNRRGPDHIDHIGGHAPPVMQCFLGIGFFFGIPDPVLYISNDPFVIFSPVPCRKCQIDR